MQTLPVYLRVIKISATVLFWLTVLTFGLMPLVIMKSSKLNGSPFFTLSLPNVTLDNVPIKLIKEVNRQVALDNTSQAKISFHYPDSARFRDDFNRYTSQFLLPTLVIFALMLLALWQIKRIFDTLGTPDVFSQANVRRIRVIACLLIIYQLLPSIVWLFIQSDIIALLDKHQIRYRINYDIKLFDIFFTGVLLFGLAEVFRSGFQLKQEQDLTI